MPPTNNLIESWNARLRDMLRRHRGLRLVRRLKAICWWCHQHTAHPETDAWLAANAMPDERLERLYRQAWERSPQGQYETFGIPARYGTGIDWNEFHTHGSNGSRTTRPPDTHFGGYRPKCVSVLACVPLWQWAFLLFELYGRGTRGRPECVSGMAGQALRHNG